MNQVPHLWAHMQAHMDSTGVREATIAKRAGTTPQTLNSWKKRGLSELPESWIIKAIAKEVHVKYDVFLRAVLHDINYLPEDVVPDARPEKKTLVKGKALRPRPPEAK
jgi:hypothetical protein